MHSDTRELVFSRSRSAELGYPDWRATPELYGFPFSRAGLRAGRAFSEALTNSWQSTRFGQMQRMPSSVAWNILDTRLAGCPVHEVP